MTDGEGVVPDVVVVGAASRDIARDDPRGWRLGGGVSYSALTTARLGLRTGALIGVDPEAAAAHELDLLRGAGVDVRLVGLAHGPVFDNMERPGGRVQHSHDAADPLPVTALPPPWLEASGWLLTPVSDELPDVWADVPPEPALVAVGWQGLLREVTPGAAVRRLQPRRNPIVARADIVGLSRDDVDPDLELGQLYDLLRPGASLAVTRGDQGGIVADGPDGEHLRLRHYPAIRSASSVDPTGAGDVFLAALAAARIQPRIVAGKLAQGVDLLLAAAAASLVLEGPGLNGVPQRPALRRRMAEGLAARAAR